MRYVVFNTGIFLSIALIVLVLPESAFAQEAGFKALQPDGGVVSGDNETFAGVLQRFFQILIAGAAILTVIMIAIGGFEYMMSDAFTKKEDARDRIWKAILGLLIIMASVLILNTINEDILNFNFLRNVEQTGTEQTGVRGGESRPALWCTGSRVCTEDRQRCEELPGSGGSCVQTNRLPSGGINLD